ncbi:hypothetical protein [Sulfoacidibacillus ferrooxidans]|uniref:Uncharacterized protein n=1 Tax=Sulfoacidibacillus ferrooxidans TaxID=2005001 RepID=A0A9X1VAU2_9BACL|nr:hypothetical protein [Sulfoacidibacillus ferrooxidans]MCI0184851.1 hypothetical protein [Sulfoacidibacillus ferrooxidans]
MIKKAEKLTKLGIAVDDHMLNRIESYRFGNWIQTRNEALLRIIDIGLTQIEQESVGDHDPSVETSLEEPVNHETDDTSDQADREEVDDTPSDDHELM